ncbi:MAG TPA: bifunctional phosphoglucose/phosphomannose isomerase [Solirubrobacterales bacterium]|jgi:glucose/mannose-6-phosphate isomerase|nr:bifunctional phosphoglucose/phosphomannose isomerase [Solirubrobacterales bacterium]
MLDDVLAIPDHLRDALWRVDSARLKPSDSAGVLVCGMGGSAVGGDLAAAALGSRLSHQLLTVRGYELPSWITAGWTVLCSSYSGETEETLACFAAAEALGARRIVASTGGTLVDSARAAGDPVIGLPGLLPAPRTAVAYMFVCALEVAAASGTAPRLVAEVEAAAGFLEAQRDDLRRRAAEVAAALGVANPVVYGAGLTAAAARRWKTQINENAKQPAFCSALPEANHNEICIWDAPSASGLAAVLLEDRDQHPRERLRFELTASEVERHGVAAVRIEVAGESPSERLLWSVMLGDLVSLELAAIHGVEPLPIEAIDRLKSSLSG